MVRQETHPHHLDFEGLAAALTGYDLIEAEAAGGVGNAATVLRMSALQSTVLWSAHIDGELVGLWGIGHHPENPRHGVPWLLKAPILVKKFRRQFIRHSAMYFNDMLCMDYDLLVNYSHADHREAHRWLRHLGFQFAPNTVPYGGHRFRQFYV